EYTPDGKWIYFNSSRTGRMQIWRMRPDGTGQEQITSDDYNNWFPHISPDGKRIAIVSYGTDVSAEDHPFYPPHGSGRQESQRPRLRLWRPGHDERALLGAGRHADRVRQQPRAARAALRTRRRFDPPDPPPPHPSHSIALGNGPMG